MIYYPFNTARTSLVVQWLRLRASTAGGMGLIPGWGSFACCAVWPNKKTKNIARFRW